MNKFLQSILVLIISIFPMILLLYPMNSLAGNWPESQTATIYSKGASLPYSPIGGTEARKQTCQGTATILECHQTLSRIPQHDVDMGRTKLALRSKDGDRELLQETLTEIWECLGYNPRTKKYLLISKNEHGVKVTLRGLVYIDEAKATFQDSIFGKKQFEAVASLYSPDGSYLALIGAPEGVDRYRLYVLNTNIDQLKLLGNPPAPPPLSKEDLANPESIDMLGPWEAPERHYTELEKGIWEFTAPHMLQVSYGKDTFKARSKTRKIKQWDLSLLR
jgi:hypothetical protein